jgi:hypothetical protein
MNNVENDDAVRDLIAREVWRYQECPWNFDKPDGMMAELQKRIAVDEAEGIRKVIMASPEVRRAFTIPATSFDMRRPSKPDYPDALEVRVRRRSILERLHAVWWILFSNWGKGWT